MIQALALGLADRRAHGLQAAVDELGWRVEWLDLPAAGRQRLAAGALPDLILTSAAGYGLEADTWRRLPLLPVVIVALPEAEAEALAAIQDGADGYLIDPGRPDHLQAARLKTAAHLALERKRLARSVEARQRFSRVQRVIGQTLLAGVDLADVLQTAVSLVHDQLGYDLAVVYLLEPEGQDMALSAVAGIEAAAVPADVYYLRRGERTVGRAVGTGRPARAAWPDNAPAHSVLGLPGYAAELSLPIAGGGRMLGALTVAQRQPTEWGGPPEADLQALAEQLAAVILNLESAQREWEQTEREQLLTHISHVANRWLGPNEVLEQTIDAVARNLRADRSALTWFDLNQAVFATEHEHINPLITERRSLKRRGPLTGPLAQIAETLQAGQCLVSTAAAPHPALGDYWAWLVQRHGVRSLIWLPVPSPVDGRLCTFSLMQVTHARRWTQADEDVLRAVAAQLALALRNAQLFDGMRQAAAQLEAKNSELEAFVYTVSHDLQAPVVSLRGFASLLQSRYRTALDERGQLYLNRIATNADFLGQLLQDLLELSRVGRREDPDEDVAVRSVLEDVLHDLGQTLAEHGVEVLLPLEWPTARYSRTRLRQVFSNLLTNAAKFMGAQARPQIEIGAQPPRRSWSSLSATTASGSTLITSSVSLCLSSG